MSRFMDIAGTVLSKFQLAIGGPQVKGLSGKVQARNAADSAYATLEAALFATYGDDFELNAGAAGSGADWTMTIRRPSSGMTHKLVFVFPSSDPSPGQALTVTSLVGDVVTLDYTTITSEQTNYTATVTLVGGAGNTVPVYSTNTAYYFKFDKWCHVQIYNTGDGGAEGAGTGTIAVALPFQAASTCFVGDIAAGTYRNGATTGPLFISIANSGTTGLVSFLAAIGSITPLTGDDQNDTNRSMTLSFSYPTAS